MHQGLKMTPAELKRMSKSRAKPRSKHSMQYKPIAPPDLLKFEIPQSGASFRTVEQGRKEISNIIHQQDDRLLVIIGPSSVQDPQSTLKYAELLHQAAIRFEDDLRVVMRCYAESPNATANSKGFMNDPFLNGTMEMNQGLRLTRQLFAEITNMGMPVAMEMFGALSHLYLGDLMSASAIGSRTAESQLHRELASSVPFPVGFISGPGENLKTAVDGIAAASKEHHYISVTPQGRVAIAWTPGNDNCFAVLKDTDESGVSIKAATEQLALAGEKPVVMVDCSPEANGQGLKEQLKAIQGVCNQVIASEEDVVGVIVESNLRKGNGAKPPMVQRTDVINNIGPDDWEATMLAMEDLAAAVRRRRHCCQP